MEKLLSLIFSDVCMRGGKRRTGCDYGSKSNLDDHVLLCECVPSLKLNLKIKLKQDKNSCVE